MTIFTALGLDPGGHTGWGRYRAEHIINPYGEHEWYNEDWTCGVLGPEPHHSDLEALLELNESREYHIICESFEHRNSETRDKVELISRDYIGVVTLTADRYDWPLHMQTASKGKVTKKSFVRKENLQRLGLWYPGKHWAHAMDGFGHILSWMCTNNTTRPFPKRTDILQIGWPNE